MYIKEGSIWKMMRNYYKTKDKSLGKNTHKLMRNYAESKIMEIVEAACDVANADNKKIVTEEHIKIVMDKMGIDISKYNKGE